MNPSRLQRLLLLILSAVLLLGPALPAGATTGESGSGPSAHTPPSTVSTPSPSAFSDIPSGFSWAADSIDYVAGDRLWMRDFGTSKFRPGLTETRVLFASAMVRAFGVPDAEPSGTTDFTDMDSDDPGYAHAALAVENGWMLADDDRFRPDKPITLHSAFRAFVMAQPLLSGARGALADLHDGSGYRFKQPLYFPTTNLGMRMYLRYNHGQEAKDLLPTDPMPRAEVAYSLHQAATISDGELAALSALYNDIALPTMTAPMRKVVEFGIRYVGYPYIWGGEWYKANSSQPTGGWDCSGYMWWIAKAPDYGYDNTKIRKYNGWNLPQRTSATMASAGKQVSFNDLKPGMLSFYDGSPGSGANVDHVDMSVGGGFALDTSSGVGGTTFLWVGSGWYRDHFQWGRKIM